MDYFIVYDLATGSELWRGSVSQGQAASQVIPEGAGLLQVPAQAFSSGQTDLSVVRAWLHANIDSEAEAIRARFITPGSGQGLTYLAKQAEAQAYLADPSSPTPFLTAEAEAVGTTVGDLAAEVSTNAVQWASIGAKIEAARRKAKIAVSAAPNIAEIAVSARVDWNAAISNTA